MSVVEVVLPVPASSPGRKLLLVERLSEEEFASFHARVWPRLWAYLRQHLPERADADDLAQEAFTRVLASTFSPQSDEDLIRYLYRTATNLLRDRGRRSRRGTSVPLAEQQGSVVPQPVGRIDLERSLQALKPKDRQLLWLAHVEGLEHRAIAEIVGAGAASVRVMLFRARQRLARLMDPPGRHPDSSAAAAEDSRAADTSSMDPEI